MGATKFCPATQGMVIPIGHPARGGGYGKSKVPEWFYHRPEKICESGYTLSSSALGTATLFDAATWHGGTASSTERPMLQMAFTCSASARDLRRYAKTSFKNDPAKMESVVEEIMRFRAAHDSQVGTYILDPFEYVPLHGDK